MSAPIIDEDESTGEAKYEYYDPYDPFAPTSWELKKNLTKAFDDEAKKPPVSSMTKKIALFEKQHLADTNAERTATNTRTNGRPPRNQEKIFMSVYADANNSEPARANTTANGRPPRKPVITQSTEKNSMSVYLRVRPLNEISSENTIEVLDGNPPVTIRTHAPRRSNMAKVSRGDGSGMLSLEHTTREFDFQQVFDQNTTQRDVYTTVVAPLVDRMTSRSAESGLVFCYGMTAAGKSYTVLGNLSNQTAESSFSDQEWGIIPRAVQDMLSRLNSAEDLFVSYFEIYCNQIYDLLWDENKAPCSSDRPEPLKLRDNQKLRRTFVRGLKKRKVASVHEGLQIMEQANSRRHTSSNNLNKGSSRSHCICQLQIIRRQCDMGACDESAVSSGYTTEEEASHLKKIEASTLWVVDLAGSERSKRTNASTARQREAALINKSLMNLMRCLSVMRENQTGSCASQLVPFRENKLTHFFMNHLTGPNSSKTCMIVNVNPSVNDFDETNHILSYASQARLVQIEKLPELCKGAEVKEYGYNGRPLVTKTKSTLSKVASFVKKLSPKKMHATINHKKRKVVASSSFTMGRSVASNSFSSTHGNRPAHQPKRMRIIKGKSSTAKEEFEVNKSLKMAMAITVAQGETEILKAEEREQIEAQVRAEVGLEMEEQLQAQAEHYQRQIEEWKRKARNSLSISTKRKRMEKASAEVDALIDQIAECEEEMVRMRKEWEEEVACLLEKLNEKDAELESTQEELKEVKASMISLKLDNNSEDLQKLKQELLESKREIARLKKSKAELVANYERLLNDEEDFEDKIEEDQGGDEEEEEESDTATVPRYMTRNHSKTKNKMRARHPLSSLLENKL